MKKELKLFHWWLVSHLASYYVIEVPGTMKAPQKTAKNWTSVSLSYYIFTGQQTILEYNS